MFVCLCNAIRENEVRELARTGARTADRVYEALGCEAHCATCTDFIQTIVDSEQPAAVATA
tara:strand:+ start:4393 stop:4575 length:183 start_codon:yes stop_codon:yes gene_type:complete